MVNNPDLLSQLYNAFNPFEPLPAGDPKYVDCQDVRGDADILQELGNRMRLSDKNTYHKTLLEGLKTYQLQKMLYAEQLLKLEILTAAPSKILNGVY